MAKDKAIGKRLRISKAQKNMFAAVAGASLILGISLVFSVYFLRYITFNSKVISEKGKAIEGYSDAIKRIGVCRSPSGRVYNNTELERCNPNEIDLTSIPGTLRYEVIMNVSQSEALESVGRNGLSICYDTSTNQKHSTDWMLERYRLATNDADREYYLEMIGMCSSLRVIPDALPSAANPLALGASLNKIFKISDYEPDGITPGRVQDSVNYPGLGEIGISLVVEGSSSETMTVLTNLEKSIREINIDTAHIEIKSSDSLKVEAAATAYYTKQAELTESYEVVKGNGKVTKDVEDATGGIQ